MFGYLGTLPSHTVLKTLDAGYRQIHGPCDANFKHVCAALIQNSPTNLPPFDVGVRIEWLESVSRTSSILDM
jgi:hypothetical protein